MGLAAERRPCSKSTWAGCIFESPAKDAGAIFTADQATAIRMHFLRDLTKAQLRRGLSASPEPLRRHLDRRSVELGAIDAGRVQARQECAPLRQRPARTLLARASSHASPVVDAPRLLALVALA